MRYVAVKNSGKVHSKMSDFYHATTKENAEKIVKEGFKIPKESEEMQWGKGLYFDKNLRAVCHHWAKGNGVALKVEINEKKCKEMKSWNPLYDKTILPGSFKEFAESEKVFGRDADKETLWKRYQRKGTATANKLKHYGCIVTKYSEGEHVYTPKMFDRVEVVVYSDKTLAKLEPSIIPCPSTKKYEETVRKFKEVWKKEGAR